MDAGWRSDGPDPRRQWAAAGCATTICHIATLDLVDAAGSGAAKTIATADGMTFVQFRPPDGRELLYRALVDGKWGLFAMDLDGHVRPIVSPTAPSGMDLTFATTTYSADGNRIFFNQTTDDASFGDSGCCQLFVVNADGRTCTSSSLAPRSSGTATQLCRLTGGGSPSGATCRTRRSIGCPSSPQTAPVK